jgi:FtsH-binding integral membrane protein
MGMPGMMGGPKFNGMAIASMICGIISMPTCMCSCIFPGINSPLAIAALVLGIIGMNKIRSAPQMYKGGGMAITGIITGSVGIILILLAAFTTLDESLQSNFPH